VAVGELADGLWEIPAFKELEDVKQWILWREEPAKKEGDKPRKVPYQINGKRASVTNPKHWTTLNEVFTTFVANGGYSGIGFVFTKDTPWSGIDLDHCREENGDISDFAERIIKMMQSYTEMSPSETGFHIIIKAKLPEGSKNRVGDIEIYEDKRYFTMTGMHYPGSPDKINKRQSELNRIAPMKKLTAERAVEARKAKAKADGPDSSDMTMESIQPQIEDTVRGDATAPVEKLNALLVNVKPFKAVWDRTAKHENWSASEWDLSVCNYLISAGWNVQEITAALIEYRFIMGEEEKLRPDYYARTISKGYERVAAVEVIDDLRSERIDEIKDPKKRRIEKFKKINKQIFPKGQAEITSVIVYQAEPDKIYKISFKNGGAMRMDIKKLKNFNLEVRGKIADATKFWPDRIEPFDWDHTLRHLLDVSEDMDVGEVATYKGQAFEWLQDFFRNQEDLFDRGKSKRPWKELCLTEASFWYPDKKKGKDTLTFCASSLRRWLEVNRFGRISNPVVGMMLTDIGCHSRKHTVRNDKGKPVTTNCWEVPDKIANMDFSTGDDDEEAG